MGGARHDRHARGRAPSHADRRGPARPARALRRRVRDGRQPRPHRRGPARRPGPARRTATTSTARSATTSPPRDGRRVMVVALTAPPVDTRCVEATGHRRGVPPARAGHRPRPRHRDRPLRRARPASRRSLRPWFAARDARDDPRARSRAPASPGAPTRRSASWSRRTRARRRQPDVRRGRPSRGRLATSCPPRRSTSLPGRACRSRRAPLLGEHTEEILADVLGLGAAEIGRLHDRGVVASAASTSSRT